MNRAIYIFLSSFCLAFAATLVPAQNASDDRPLGFERRREEPVPKNVLETREKMRIDKESKDHAEMLDRGEEVLKLAERVSRSFNANGRLSETDLATIGSIERDVKKIRDDLGGDDGDEKVDDLLGEHDKQPTVADAVATLKTTTATLMDELKKTTRFTISAAAIESSNAVLAITRFLRSGK